MKKIIALLLVVVMAMMMFACGGNKNPETTEPGGTTAQPDTTDPSGTTASTNKPDDPKTTAPTTPSTGTTTPVVNPPEDDIDRTKTIVYLPVTHEGDVALNITNGKEVGKITSTEELEGGHFYLVDKTTLAVVEDLGTARGKTGRTSIDMAGKLIASSWKDSFKYHDYDCANFSAVTNPTKLAEGKTLGKFGTMEITKVTADSILATVDGEENVDITNYKWQFVYFDYYGNEIHVAKKKKNSLPVLSYNDVIKLYGHTADFFEKAADLQAHAGTGGDEQFIYVFGLQKEVPMAWYARKLGDYNTVMAKEDATDEEKEAAKGALDLAIAACEMVVEDLMYYQDDIYWSSDVASTRLYLDVKAAEEAEKETKLPIFDYFFDAETETYIVYITTFRYAGDMTDNKNSRVKITNPAAFDGAYTID